jgi:hypothetical protein
MKDLKDGALLAIRHCMWDLSLPSAKETPPMIIGGRRHSAGIILACGHAQGGKARLTNGYIIVGCEFPIVGGLPQDNINTSAKHAEYHPDERKSANTRVVAFDLLEYNRVGSEGEVK